MSSTGDKLDSGGGITDLFFDENQQKEDQQKEKQQKEEQKDLGDFAIQESRSEVV